MQRHALPMSIFALAAAILFMTTTSVASAGPTRAVVPSTGAAKAACLRIAAPTEHYTEEAIQKLLSSGRTDVMMAHKTLVCAW